MNIPNPQVSDSEIITYIQIHAEGLRDYLRPDVKMFLNKEHMFNDLREIFQQSYEDFVLGLVYNYLTDSLKVGYPQLSELIDFTTLTRLLELDPRGRNV